MADHDSTPIYCSCCALDIHYDFVVLSAPASQAVPARFARGLTPAQQARILAKLRSVHDHASHATHRADEPH